MQGCLDVYAKASKEGNSEVCETVILAAVNLLMTETCTSKALVEMGIPVWKAFVLLAHAFEKDPDNHQINLAYSAVSFLLGASYLE